MIDKPALTDAEANAIERCTGVVCTSESASHVELGRRLDEANTLVTRAVEFAPDFDLHAAVEAHIEAFDSYFRDAHQAILEDADDARAEALVRIEAIHPQLSGEVADLGQGAAFFVETRGVPVCEALAKRLAHHSRLEVAHSVWAAAR